MKKPSHLPLPSSGRSKIAEIIRVDHAGEYGAKRIYEGQLAVKKTGLISKEIKEMYEQELVHLKYFESAIVTQRVRPTILQPLWHIFGFAMGAATAAIGDKAAMACTVAVEDVIEEHYNSQLEELTNHRSDTQLKEKIKKFRDEELEHRDKGIANKAQETRGYKFLYRAVQLATKTAIFLSKKI